MLEMDGQVRAGGGLCLGGRPGGRGAWFVLAWAGFVLGYAGVCVLGWAAVLRLGGVLEVRCPFLVPYPSLSAPPAVRQARGADLHREPPVQHQRQVLRRDHAAGALRCAGPRCDALGRRWWVGGVPGALAAVPCSRPVCSKHLLAPSERHPATPCLFCGADAEELQLPWLHQRHWPVPDHRWPEGAGQAGRGASSSVHAGR